MRIEDRVQIHDATADHVAAIAAIYNDAVENTTAIWNDQIAVSYTHLRAYET